VTVYNPILDQTKTRKIGAGELRSGIDGLELGNHQETEIRVRSSFQASATSRFVAV
jgi:hypothetical protein